MKVLGIDFTSAPKGSKPITVATGELAESVLRIGSVRGLNSFERFEDELDSPGPWIAGMDFPFGQPLELIQALQWPMSWKAYVGRVGSMEKHEYESAIRRYSAAQPDGCKEHKRVTDKQARSISPMKLFFQPVGKMFFQGAPRILRSGACIVPCALNGDNRVIVEAYPALAAQALAGTRSYKSDDRSKQTPEHRRARSAIVSALTAQRCGEVYGFTVDLQHSECERLIDDAGADFLDAVLCAIQAAWSYSQPNFGVPDSCDPLEGWIVDPSQLQPEASPPRLFRDDNPPGWPRVNLLDRITTSPSICHGKPCIRGLRYPVDMILELLSSGMTTEEVLADYDDLELEDVLAVLAFAAHLSRVKRVQALAS